MKNPCKFAFFFAPLFCCLFLQSCNSLNSNINTNETTVPPLVTVLPVTTPIPKDTEIVVSPEAASQPKSASEVETEETLDEILNQLDELDAILDGY